MKTILPMLALLLGIVLSNSDARADLIGSSVDVYQQFQGRVLAKGDSIVVAGIEWQRQNPFCLATRRVLDNIDIAEDAIIFNINQGHCASSDNRDLFCSNWRSAASRSGFIFSSVPSSALTSLSAAVFAASSNRYADSILATVGDTLSVDLSDRSVNGSLSALRVLMVFADSIYLSAPASLGLLGIIVILFVWRIRRW